MKLSEFKNHLSHLSEIDFVLPSGDLVPAHYHITEVGQINKHFIDCGGTVRKEKSVSFQLWYSSDTDHRVTPAKVLQIITMAEGALALEDAEIEVEYQSDTIGKFGLALDDGRFHLLSKATDCLAKEGCEVPVKKKVDLSSLIVSSGECEPGSGCC